MATVNDNPDLEAYDAVPPYAATPASPTPASPASADGSAAPDSPSSPAPSALDADVGFSVENADAVDDLLTAPTRGALYTVLRIREDAVHVRFLTKSFITLPAHFSVKDDSGTFLALRCNRPRCALCLAHRKPTVTHLLAVFCVDTNDINVLQFYRKGGAGSLRNQIIPLLRRPDYTDLIVELAKDGFRSRVTIAQVRGSVTASDFPGDEVIQNIIANGGIEPADLAQAIEQRPNQVLLDDIPGLREKVRLCNPGIDLDSL